MHKISCHRHSDSMKIQFFYIFSAKNDKDEDDIALIIGIVVGVSLLVVLIALLMAFLVYRSKQSTKVESMRSTSPPYQRSFENKGISNDHEMTPV